MALTAAAPSDAAPPADTAASALLAPFHGDLEAIRARGYLRVLVCLSRTHYFVDRGTQRGLAYEAAIAFERYLNADRSAPRVSAAFIPVDRSELLDALVAGRGDIAIANLTITPRRLRRVEFSAPFATGVKEIVMTSASHEDLPTWQALTGQQIYVRRSSSYFDHLSARSAELVAAGRPAIDIVPIDERLEDEDLLEMVSAGLLPATVVDDHIAALWLTVLPNLRAQATIHEGGSIAWAMRKQSPELKRALDQFAAQNRAGTLHANILLQRYLRDNRWIRNATAEAELARFRNAVALFRTYGDQYDLPWLLIAAQAYQESGIDQSKRSPAGAVGIMQIKPTTAAGSPIFITGVDASAARNVEAGAKYLRFIVDEYFADEPMDRLNKGLFAVASYNAGPARIARLRTEAEATGLDPNVWFDNVEVIAARRIGRETVTYVRNVFKYYVSYQIALAQSEAKAAARKRAAR